ncbi:acyltransferase family protein [Marinospirillum sp.]|uniref:acyltransferase family protein n=1 Tax=Marinospirillum sp. TaxID=2183934 RepID=UPI0038506918
MMKYRSEIDGLRSIAVIPVIFFHAGFSLFSGGYVGVDVFFVISGYLITTILIDQISAGKFSIVDFYERRARRILPALFFVMLCTIPFAWLWMVPQQFKDFSQALVAISFFASNILFWRKEDYFAPAAEENPMLHTWSLAVEEQFYIFFPILLLILWRFGKSPVFYTVLLFSFLSLLLAEYGWRNHPTANFYLLPTRAWELGVGAISAFLLHGKAVKPNQILSGLGLLMIAYSIFAFDQTVPFPSVYALVPVIGTALIILFGSKGTYIKKLLSAKILVGVGLISFSAYLWHQPLFALARIRGLDIDNTILMFSLSLASILLAYFSWRYVELPFRKKGGAVASSSRFSRNQVFGIAVVFSLGFIGFGFYGHINNGLEQRTAPSGYTFKAIDIDARLKVNHGLNSDCTSFTLSENCRTVDNADVMLWGDSYAMHLAQAIVSSPSFEGQDHGLIQFTKSVCSPIPKLALTNNKYTQSWAEGCIKFNDAVIDWLNDNSNIRYVVMSSPMGILGSDAFDSNGELVTETWDSVLGRLIELREAFDNLGVKGVFVAPPPRSGRSLSQCLVHSLTFGSNQSCDFSAGDFSERHELTMKFLLHKDFPFKVVNLEDWLCNEKKCSTVFTESKTPINIFRDGGHLSHQGSAELGRRFDLFGTIKDTLEK